MPRHHITLLLIISFFLTALSRPFVLILTQDDLADDDEGATSATPTDWDELEDAVFDLDPNPWRPVFDPDFPKLHPQTDEAAAFYSSLVKMVAGEVAEAAVEMEAVAETGNPHAQSALGFMYGLGIARGRDRGRSFMYHNFAAQGGSLESKVVLAYTYLRQERSYRAPLSPHPLPSACVTTNQSDCDLIRSHSDHCPTLCSVSPSRVIESASLLR